MEFQPILKNRNWGRHFWARGFFSATSGNVMKSINNHSDAHLAEFQPILKNRNWGRHFWARGFFSATSGNVTDEMIHEYINNHSDAHQPDHIDNIRLE